jgi:hypothetical protein
MSLFQQLGQQGQQPRQEKQQDPRQALNEIKADPASFLKQAGLSVPEGMTDPQQMVWHIIDSGQVRGPRAQFARRLMGR